MYPDCFLLEKETTDRSLLYPEPNNQATFCQSCLKAMHMVGLSQCVALRQQARLLTNILIMTSKLCRNGGFTQITQTPSNTHIMAENSTIFHS